jgi:gamma-butyrobetaine dioxygenase
MKDMEPLPITPDFDVWPVTHTMASVCIADGDVEVTWDDGQSCIYHRFLLAENDPAPEVVHPKSRETILAPTDFPDDLKATGARIRPNGALEVHWNDDRAPSVFHPGWLRAHGWFGEAPAAPAPRLWRAEEMAAVPSFDGPTALQDRTVFLDWLVALRDYGVARLEGLPQQDGLLEDIVSRIGVMRSSNFGTVFTLEIKDDPDSNAYTPHKLAPHTDLSSRECPPGLQFLYTRANTTTGGEGTYSDAYQIAEDLRREDPETFHDLTTIPWRFNNRGKTSSYQAAGPVIALDADGQITEIRYTVWLRAPMVAPPEVQARAYRSVRAFAKRAEDPRYMMQVRYKAGDLFAFDNRRALHGRMGYDAKGGERFIEGVYSDRDELHSAIRVLEREILRDRLESAG